jgi:NAD(P)-dependent dehydrogenase (short-subunit alcohol dehydrogenase family)
MNLLNVLCRLTLLRAVQGWALTPCKIKQIGRKAFLAGAATGVVIGVAGVAGAAAAVDQVQKNRPSPYEAAPGSMNGKVVLITGGSSGLGLESAKRLGAAGATIVLTSRNLSKGEKAVKEVEQYLSSKGVGSTEVYNLLLDLDDLDSVKSFPSSFQKLDVGKIDVLLNNAGVMAIPDLQLTKDGYERTFQSNHLGHFVLTAGLFPYLNKEKATVVNVSSAAYNIAAGKGLELDNLNGEKQYGAWSSYGQSKLSNILFTQELQRRADAAGDSWLTTVTLHPGAVQTDLGRYVVGQEKWNDLKSKGPSGLESFLLNAAALFTKTVEEGASTQVFLASGAEGALKKGAYYDELKSQNLPAFAKDENKAKLLWTKSEELGGIKFNLGSVSTKVEESPSNPPATE